MLLHIHSWCLSFRPAPEGRRSENNIEKLRDLRASSNNFVFISDHSWLYFLDYAHGFFRHARKGGGDKEKTEGYGRNFGNDRISHLLVKYVRFI